MTYQEILEQEISIDQLELIVIDLPQKGSFKSAIGIRKSRKAMLVKWTDKDGAIGYGECSCRPDPFYSSEFLKGALQLAEQFIWPVAKAAGNYQALLDGLQKIRGWQFTKAAVEFALNDLLLRKTGKDLLSSWSHERVEQVPVGISLGLQENRAALEKAVSDAIALGYRRLKFKINPKSDPADFQWIREQMPELYLSFDANGSFYEQDLPLLAAFAEMDCMIEQPHPPSRADIALKGKAEIPKLFSCLDESVKSMGSLHLHHQVGLLDELNLKPGRVGGLAISLQMLDFCRENEISCWIGGMFETGIGRTANLRIAGCLPKAKAHDLSPSHRYFLEDLIEQPIEMSEDGFVDASKLGATQVREDLIRKYEVERLILK
jgi:O-succinylbenzoate synthase